MGRPRGSKNKKSKYEALDLEFRSSVEGGDEAAIRAIVAKVAFNEHDNQIAKKDDQDLANAVEQAKIAGEQYKEATKMNKLRIAYCHTILDARGKV